MGTLNALGKLSTHATLLIALAQQGCTLHRTDPEIEQQNRMARQSLERAFRDNEEMIREANRAIQVLKEATTEPQEVAELAEESPEDQ